MFQGLDDSNTEGTITLKDMANKNFYLKTGIVAQETIISSLYIEGTNGADNISNTLDNATINAFAGDDTVYNDNGDYSTIDAGDGNDSIYGNDNDYVSINAGTGNDTIEGYYYDSTINGGAGNDYISGFNGGLVNGGAGNDEIIIASGTVSGGAGNDTISFDSSYTNNLVQYASGDGNDVIYGITENDILHITSGYVSNATISGNDVVLTVGNGSITLKDMADQSFNLKIGSGSVQETVINNYYITGTNGADSISNTLEGATVVALAGNDTVYNTGFLTTINGDAGNDIIINSVEGVVYQYSTGDGTDVIYGFTSYDTLYIANGTISNSVLSGNDVILTVGTGTITLKDMEGKAFNLKLSDGTDKVAVLDNYTITGTSGNDMLTNTIEDALPNATINALAGNDTVVNTGDNVLILGGEGNDYISNFPDTYAHDVDTDRPFIKKAVVENPRGNGEYVTIDSGAGNDTIYNSADFVTISGGAGNDSIQLWSSSSSTVNGGTGDDTIDFISSDNIVIQYAEGDGNDVITYSMYGYTLHITSGSVSNATTSGNDVVLTVGTGSITLKDMAEQSFKLKIENGSTQDTILNNLYIEGTNRADSISNTLAGATINALAGDDSINNSANNVSINAGAGEDTVNIYGSRSGITIDGGEGDDRVYDNNGGGVNKSYINLGAGRDMVLFDYGYYGTASITVDGGADNDLLDFYRNASDSSINGGAGNDTIRVGHSTATIESIYNTILGGTGDDSIEVYSHYTYIEGGAGKDYILNSGGNNVTINGGDNDDTISIRGSDSGSNGYKNSILGGAGNDSIYNNGGEKITIDSGTGDDTIYNTGDDAYIVAGDGDDSIYTGGSNVTIDAGKGNNSITLWKISNSIIESGADNDSILVGINSSRATNNTILSGAGDDYINGSTGISLNYIDTGEGDDKIYLYSPGNNNTIIGGKGSDTISRTQNYSTGTLIYSYADGDGDDFIYSLREYDTLHVTSGSISSSLASGGDVILTIGTGSITLKDAAGKKTYLKLGTAAAKSVTLPVTVNPYYIEGTNDADTIKNTLDGATINALAGNDTIQNSGGNVSINGGEGRDSIENRGNNVVIEDDTGNNKIHNMSGENIKISTGAGNDSIYSYGANATIESGDGNDSISNSGRNSKIDAGTGDNTIGNYDGGAYTSIKSGDGNDSIENYGQNSTVDASVGDDYIKTAAVIPQLARAQVMTLLQITPISLHWKAERAMTQFIMSAVMQLLMAATVTIQLTPKTLTTLIQEIQ